MPSLADYARNLVLPRARAPVPRYEDAAPAVRASAPFELRDYMPEDRTTVIDLLAQGRPAHYQRMKEAVFDWQFRGNPHDDGSAPLVVGTVGDEIVAVNGFMPVQLRYQGKTVQASWSCDTFVSSRLRGWGFGKQLIRRVSERAPVMLGYGISDMSDPILEKNGWALHPALRVLFFHVSEPGFKGTLKDLCTQVAMRVRGVQAPRLEVTRHAGEFGPEVDELWQRSAPGYLRAVQRDAAYLNWKYHRHPVARYEWYAARESGRLRGLIVARHSRTASVLVDYCGPADDIDLMSGLVGEATAALAERGTMRVQCESTHRPLLAALERSGFIGSHYRPRFRVRSNVRGDEHPAESWLLMGGDSDGDMLSESMVAQSAGPPSIGAGTTSAAVH